MSVEQPIEMLLMPVAEMIRPPQEREAGSDAGPARLWGAAALGGGVAVPGVPG